MSTKVYRVRIENPRLKSNIELFFEGTSREDIKKQILNYMAFRNMSPDRKVEIFDY